MKARVSWKHDATYEGARVERVFNQLKPNRFPAGIVHAASVDDVVDAVKLAAAKGLKVTVRSGGHSWPAWSLRDNSLCIDLANLKEISYDEKTQVVTAAPATTGRMLNPDFLKAKGRFFPGGHCPSVGIGGFLLQGGQGWNCRGWKWACEYIVSMDVVTADGRLVTASEKENSDLFWAARGAGLGFFGVVVRFRLQTLHLHREMRKSILIFPASAYDETFPAFQRLCPKFDTDVELVYLGLSRMRCLADTPGNPKDPFLVISATAWKDTIEECAAALAPMKEVPGYKDAVVFAENIPSSFSEEYDLQERDNPPDCRFFCNNAWINGSPEEVADSLRHSFLEMPTADSYTLYYSQAPLRKLPDMAFDMQTSHYFASYVMATGKSIGSTGEPITDKECQEWIADTMARIDGKRGGPGGSPGQYLGDSDLLTRPARFMSEDHWAKWVEIRAKWDPKSLFYGFGVGKSVEENLHVFEIPRAAALAKL